MNFNPEKVVSHARECASYVTRRTGAACWISLMVEKDGLMIEAITPQTGEKHCVPWSQIAESGSVMIITWVAKLADSLARSLNPTEEDHNV